MTADGLSAAEMASFFGGGKAGSRLKKKKRKPRPFRTSKYLTRKHSLLSLISTHRYDILGEAYESEHFETISMGQTRG